MLETSIFTKIFRRQTLPKLPELPIFLMVILVCALFATIFIRTQGSRYKEQKGMQSQVLPRIHSHKVQPPAATYWHSNRLLAPGISDETKASLHLFTPAGDTYFMRHEGVFNDILDQHTRRLFQLAHIATSYPQKKALLLDIASTSQDLLKYRAYLAISRAAFRSDLPEAADDRKKYALSASQLSLTDHKIKADSYYLLALCERDNNRLGSALTYLYKALEKDEVFLDAHLEIISLLLQMLASRVPLVHSDPLEISQSLLKHLTAYTQLTQNSDDYIDLAMKLQSQAFSNPEVDFAIGYCFYHAGAREPAENYFLRVLEKRHNIQKEIVAKSQAFLAEISSEKKRLGKI